MLNSPTINFPDSIILCLSILLLSLVSSAVQAQTPRTPEDYFKRGVARYDKGDYEGAIADYDLAIEINSRLTQTSGNNPGAWKSIGAEGSITNNERIAVIDPFNANAYYNRGLARREKGNLDGAIADFGRTIAITPRNAAAYSVRGVARITQGDIKGAIANKENDL
jgi:tetratricopeptide (TPR) repeat protein